MLPPRRITPQTNNYPTFGEVTPILPNLYLSSLSALQTCLAQSSLPITHILSILDAPVDLPGFTGSRLVIVLSDNAESDLLSRLDECVEYVQSARLGGGTVVVHCLMGLSRSVCVVAACVVADSGVRVGKALRVVKKKRGWE
ncbi:Dual specificity phosphatase, catalytic domain, partial [Rhizoctonia solani]